MKRLLAIFIVLLITQHTYAETLELKSGKIVIGTVISQDEDAVQINVKDITLTFWIDEIESIDGQQVGIKESPSIIRAPLPKDPVLQNNKPIIPDIGDTFASDESLFEQSDIPQPQHQEDYEVTEDEILSKYFEHEETEEQIKKEKMKQDIIKSWDDPPKPRMNMLGRFLMILITLVALLIYIAAVYPYYLMATKTNSEVSFWAFIPVLNMFLILDLAKKPAWWLFLMIVPFVNLIIIFLVYGGLAERCHKPRWVGFLIILPFCNILLPWYLALSFDPVEKRTFTVSEDQY